MKQDLKVKLLEELFAQIVEDRNADAGQIVRSPADVYVDPDIAEKEKRILFQDRPQLIGLSGRLPEPGSFFTVDDFGTPALAVRDDNGNFRAFLNICRHRGVRLTAEENGAATRFVCPFHAWTYELTGEFRNMPKAHHFGAMEKSCNNLIALPAEERHGMLWVHPNPGGELNLDEFLGALNDEFSTHDMANLVYTGTQTLDKRLNWKLANDTFGETWHFPILHRNTLGGLFPGNNLAYEEIGPHHRFVFATAAIETLRNLPKNEWQLKGYANLLYYLFPNIQLNFGDGPINIIRIYPHPEDPSRSITRVDSYFPREVLDAIKAAEEDPAIRALTAEEAYEPDTFGNDNIIYGVEAIAELFKSTIEHEDYTIGEQQQLAAESGHLKELLFGHNEPALQHYHHYIREALGLPPLEKADELETNSPVEEKRCA